MVSGVEPQASLFFALRALHLNLLENVTGAERKKVIYHLMVSGVEP